MSISDAGTIPGRHSCEVTASMLSPHPDHSPAMKTTLASPGILRWRQLPALPDREGFAGSFAGVSEDVLLVAGGANFPDQRPWEGGTKHWHDGIFALEPGAKGWREAGRLPTANGYGVAVTAAEGVVLAGGGDARRNFAEVWLARWERRTVTFTAWPALPRPLAQAAGALAGRILYVAGGIDRPDATQAQQVLYALDLDRREAGWQELTPCPGAERILAVAAAQGDAFYFLGGARLEPDEVGQPRREWLRDAWRFTPREGWRRLADLPRAAVAAPTPAPLVAGQILVLGGDDGGQLGAAPAVHRGFSRDILAYAPAADAWSRLDSLPFSHVTTPAVAWGTEIVVPGGEVRPGIRSPEIWAATTGSA